jgi:hypothetical protein
MPKGLSFLSSYPFTNCLLRLQGLLFWVWQTFSELGNSAVGGWVKMLEYKYSHRLVSQKISNIFYDIAATKQRETHLLWLRLSSKLRLCCGVGSQANSTDASYPCASLLVAEQYVPLSSLLSSRLSHSKSIHCVRVA